MGRVFLIVLDSCGVGAMPDAAKYGDEGSFTLKSAATSEQFSMPNAEKLGLFHIDGVRGEVCGSGLGGVAADSFDGVVCRLAEVSEGKDTTTGHWEIAGLPLAKPFPTALKPTANSRPCCSTLKRKCRCKKNLIV